MALTAAEVFARLATASGDPLDATGLAFILLERGMLDRTEGRELEAIHVEAEAVYIVAVLADAGYERAAELLSTFSDHVSPAALLLAKAYPPASPRAAVETIEAGAKQMMDAGHPRGAILYALTLCHKATLAEVDADALALTRRAYAVLQERAAAGNAEAGQIARRMIAEMGRIVSEDGGE